MLSILLTLLFSAELQRYQKDGRQCVLKRVFLPSLLPLNSPVFTQFINVFNFILQTSIKKLLIESTTWGALGEVDINMKNTDFKWVYKPTVTAQTQRMKGVDSTELAQFRTVNWTPVKRRRVVFLCYPSWIRWLTFWMLPNPGEKKSFLMQLRANTLLRTFKLMSRRIQMNVRRKIRRIDLATK